MTFNSDEIARARSAFFANANRVPKASEQRALAPAASRPKQARPKDLAIEPHRAYELAGALSAGDISDEVEHPDRMIDGFLANGKISMLYGDSNAGKSFLAVDVGGAVAEGREWMGRKVWGGVVVYIASEAPEDIRLRVQAYKREYGVRLDNFFIVQNPLNLFMGERDTEIIIGAVKHIEATTGKKVKLIIGDTLAALSEGGNENASQDMGPVVKRVKRIRADCNAHFMLIHHVGKNDSLGPRGWSGVRAVVDTAAELTENAGVHCIEIKKERSLGTKGNRFGFTLQGVSMGFDKHGIETTTAVVVQTDVPIKTEVAKRASEVEGAIVEYMATVKVGMKKKLVVDHFNSRYQKSVVYRGMKKLVAAGALHDVAGMVAIATAVLK
jgi:putative DNA primase/helicase